jgi:DNA-binding winged helix-turn-helix (wHTH) protein
MTMPATLEEAYEEIRNLRRDLGIETEHRTVAKIHAGMKVSPQQATMLATLWRRADKISSRSTLMTAMYGDGDGPENDKIVAVQLCKINKSVGVVVVANVWGKGYALTPDGRKLIDKVLSEPMAVRLDRRGQQWTMQGNMGVLPYDDEADA